LGNKEFKIPDLVSLSFKETEKLLKGYELLVGNITYVPDSEQKEGGPKDDRKRTLVRAGELVDL